MIIITITTTTSYLLYERFVGWDMVFPLRNKDKKNKELRTKGEGRICYGSDMDDVGSKRCKNTTPSMCFPDSIIVRAVCV